MLHILNCKNIIFIIQRKNKCYLGTNLVVIKRIVVVGALLGRNGDKGDERDYGII